MSQPNLFLFNGVSLNKFEAHKTPEFKEHRSKDWVLFGTDEDWKNRYPDYLVHLYNSSPKNNAIINKKCEYIKGQGLTSEGAGLALSDKLAMGSYLAKIEDSKVRERISLDLVLFGGFSAEMIYNKGGDKVEPFHVDFSNVRVSKPVWSEELNDWEKPTYFYTSDWSVRKPQDNPDFTEFYCFDPNEPMDKNKRYLYYYKEYRPDLGVYPLPDYLASIPYISADYEISNFTVNNVKNGFSGGYLVNFYNGEPSEDQKREIVNSFDAVLHGTDNAGKSIKSFNEDKDSGVEITPLSANGQDDRYLNLNNTIRDEIYTGHGVDPVIAGLKGDSGWSNNADEKRVAVEEWQNSYIDSKQSIIETFLTNVANFNGIKGRVDIIKKRPTTAQASESEIREILTLEERRERIGYSAKKPNEQKMSKDDVLYNMFDNCGISDEELEFIDSRQVPILGTDDAFKKEQEYKQEFATRLEISILKLLIGGANPVDIQKSLGINEEKYNESIVNLTNEGYLTDDGDITQSGEEESKKDEIFVVYKYAKRNDVSGSDIIDTTRDFCKNMVTQSKFKSWTLDEIKLMNNGMGLDVFTSRGGWRTIEGSSPARHVPFCRHIWEQRLVRRR